MTLLFDEDTVQIDGVCGVEEALPLLEFLQHRGAARIDMRSCSHLHSAALQVLMATAASDTGARVTALPEEAFLRRWLTPLLGFNSPAAPDAAAEHSFNPLTAR